MSLGWGLSGFIGGGPLGAMIPGAMIGLVIWLLLGRDRREAGLVVAFAAVGIGYGGQETYGQTVGFSVAPATRWFGLVGLALKGAVWGLLGGAVIGAALERPGIRRRDLLIAIAAGIAGTHAGWKIVNEPKLLYFSDPVNKPREELWAGLLLAGLAFLGWLWRHPVPRVMALWGCLGGGLGFGLGGWFQSMGREHANTPWVEYWKLMEFTFGFLLGAGLAHAARRVHEALPDADEGMKTAGWLREAVAGALVMTAALVAYRHVPGRYEYTVVGGALLALVLAWPRLGVQIGIAMTYCAFAIDFQRNNPQLHAAVLWVLIVLTTAAVAIAAARMESARALLLLVMWTAVAMSVAKSYARGIAWNGHAIVEVVFVLMAVAVTRMSRRLTAPAAR